MFVTFFSIGIEKVLYFFLIFPRTFKGASHYSCFLLLVARYSLQLLAHSQKMGKILSNVPNVFQLMSGDKNLTKIFQIHPIQI